MRKSFILTFVTFALSSVSSAGLMDNFPGAVPLKYTRQAASGLERNGETLQPDEVRALVTSGEIKDLTEINPSGDSNTWANTFPQETPNDVIALEINPQNEELEVLDVDYGPSGRLIIHVLKRFEDGRVKNYRVWIDDKGHNMLARKALLRKIGYIVPPSTRLALARLKFRGAFSKKNFVEQILKKRIFKDPLRWVVDGVDVQDEYLTLKDLIIFGGSTNESYDLSQGTIDRNVIRGKRVYNSLLVPNALTDSPESINLMSWSGYDVSNKYVIFPYEYARFYNPSLEDVRWIMLRILKLKRSDWEEIADASQMPLEPRALFLEKMLSIRKGYREILGLENFSENIEPKTDITIKGGRLTNGKLVGGRQWDGYARNFAGVDPDSPQSFKEVTSLLESKIWSNVVLNLVNDFNSRFLPHTDLGFKIFDHQLDVAAHQFAEYLITGKVSETAVGVWKTDFHNIDLILSREIVAGSYMGTENRVQLADTIGAALEGGKFYLWEGLPQAVQAFGRARIKAMLTYTHIKPVVSMEKSLSEPVSNMVVPYLKSQSIVPLEKILAMEGKIRRKELQGDAIDDEFKKNFDEWVSSFGEGDSFIIAKSFAPGLDFGISKSLSKNLTAYVKMQEQVVALWRVHIVRRDKKTVQVYFNFAGYNDFAAAIGAKFKISLFDIGIRWPVGKGFTKFFNFSLDTNLEDNKEFFNNVAAVIAALKGEDEEFLSKIQKPWSFDMDFSDRQTHFDILVWKNAWSKARKDFLARDPDGLGQSYIYRTRGERFGKDYESLAVEIANVLLQKKYPNRRILTTTSGNPGDTVFGSAVSRLVSAESRKIPGPLDLNNFYGQISYRWKGWQFSRKDIEGVLDDIQNMFGQTFFRKVDLGETEKLQFYSIEVQISVYRRAMEHMLGLTKDKVADIFRRESKRPPTQDNDRSFEQTPPWATWINGDLDDLRAAFRDQNHEEFTQELVDVLEVAESQLTFKGYLEFVGALDNLYIQGVIRGFRLGSEGQTEIKPIPLGQIGAFEPRGPIYTLQSNIGILGGELLLNHLVNPL